jgi:RND superfamily putative drug exporter
VPEDASPGASRWEALERALGRHRRLVGVAWLAAVVAALPLAARQSEHLTGGGFTVSDSQSGVVEEAVADGRFAGAANMPLALVLAPRQRLDAAQLSQLVREIGTKAGVEDVQRVDVPARTRTALRAGRPGLVALRVPGPAQNSIDAAKRLRRELEMTSDRPARFAGGAVTGHLVGQGALWASLQEVADEALVRAERTGFPIIALVLLVAFGSLPAALLPLAFGAVAVVLAGAFIYLLSLATSMSIFVTSVASLIGIGVAVDYSLFILVRYREELHRGRDPGEARGVALRSSGRAVAFSGLTVLASLAGLFLIDSPGIRSMAAGAMLVVAISVLVALTLLPVLLGALGTRLARRRSLRRRTAAVGGGTGTFWKRWTGVVMRHPVVSAGAATALLLALAVPALSIHVRNNAGGQLPASNEARRGAAIAAQLAGPGALGPIQVLVRFDPRARSDERRALVDELNRTLAAEPSVTEVARPRPAAGRDEALLAATSRDDPESEAAHAAVRRLRARLPDVAGPRAEVAVGGTSALLLDFDELATGSMWKLMLFVLALSFVVLVPLLRSIVLPLKAILMNILSVGAAYGVLVIVYQWGWLAPLGVEKAPAIYPATLPLVLVVVFGLSMDYHVFLLSRIRERYAQTRDNRTAVADALAASAGTITSAALIMVAVFISFVAVSVPQVKQIGLASAVAVALDATLVRLVVVPAAMELLGRANWWLPRPLARRLPGFDPLGAEGPAT